MLRVVGCITHQHDLRLVLLAGLICAMASFTFFSLAARAEISLAAGRSGWPRHGWLSAAAFVAGSGIWATHFVAALAFRPGLPVAFDIDLTILSIVIAIGLCGVGVALWEFAHRPLIGGAVTGAAIAAMHYTGMAALRMPADVRWDHTYIVASVFIGVLSTSLAFAVAERRKNLSGRLIASGLLVCGIVGLHFTGMAAVSFAPDPAVIVPAQSIQPEWFAIAIAAVTSLIIGLGLFGSVVDQHLASRSSREAARLRDYVVALEATKRDLEQTAVRLRVALEAKSLFLATMSHELRTPLNAIIGFSQLLESQLFGPIENPRYREYHRHILESGSHLLNLINDVLDVSKLEAGHLELREEEVDTGAILAECVNQLRPQAEKANIALHIADKPPSARLRADPGRLRQILLNVISNAVKFTPEGGDVCVSGRRTASSFDVVVDDTGIGMSPDDIPKALEFFGQIDNSLSRRYDGTGLGLPLAKQLMISHGGTLAIDSIEGRGTKVTLSFPGTRICDRREAA